MAAYGVSLVVTYTAWDKSTDSGKTGDVANHTLSWIKDGVAAVPTNAPAEVAGGEYSLTLTAAEAQAKTGTLRGTSSTANVIIIPTKITFVKVPDVASGSAGGLPVLDANSRISAKVTEMTAGVIAAATFAAGAFDAVWTVANRTLTAFGFTVTLNAAQPNYAPSKAGDAMTLTVGERSAVATSVEAAILDEGDATALLAAIAAKVEEFLINEGDATATLQAIATAVTAALGTGAGLTSLADKTTLDAIAVKTGNLPADPAGVSNIPTAAQIRTEMDTNSMSLAAIIERTENLPDDPANEASVAAVDSKLARRVELIQVK